MTERSVAKFETAAATHPGTAGRENQDAYLDGSQAGLWAVADGMGGHHAGRYASHTLVEALRTIRAQASAADLLQATEACVIAVNSEILRVADDNNTTIGTTLAVLLVHGLHYACIWAGDSRIYLIQANAIALVSRDHTEVQSLVDRGLLTEPESRVSSHRRVITRAIGVSEQVELELTQGTLAQGDTFLLCSDGLTNCVADAELGAMLGEGSADQACNGLIGLAVERGGTDNITAVVMRYHDDGPPVPGGSTLLDADWPQNDRTVIVSRH